MKAKLILLAVLTVVTLSACDGNNGEWVNTGTDDSPTWIWIEHPNPEDAELVYPCTECH